jgi:hypothetical protein
MLMPSFLLTAALTAVLAPALTQESSAAAPLFGTWRFNPAKSNYSSEPPFSRATCRIEPWRDGLRVIYDMVGTRGGTAHWEWSGRVDGRDYALQGIDDVVTNAYSRIDDYNYQIVNKVDGRVATITRITISTDGKTMTASNTLMGPAGQSPGTTLVWEKQ